MYDHILQADIFKHIYLRLSVYSNINPDIAINRLYMDCTCIPGLPSNRLSRECRYNGDAS